MFAGKHENGHYFVYKDFRPYHPLNGVKIRHLRRPPPSGPCCPSTTLV